MAFHSRPVDMPHLVLHCIRPPNRILEKLMEYRSYCFKLVLDAHTRSEINKVRLHIKNMTTTLKKNMFRGADTIRVFDFLRRFVTEADDLKMT